MFVWEATDVVIMLSQFEGGGLDWGWGVGVGAKATGEEGDGKTISCRREVWTSVHRKPEMLARRECVRLNEFELKEKVISAPPRGRVPLAEVKEAAASLLFNALV